MQAEKVEVPRATGSPGARPEIVGVHPELAGPVVADEAHPLQACLGADRRAQEHGDGPARRRRDPFEAIELARRLDGDDPHAGAHRRP